MISVSII